MQNLNYFTPANDIGIWRCKKKMKTITAKHGEYQI